jgi:diadenosine tetraphosphate (Ap4A) HIT family hydrolase
MVEACRMGAYAPAVCKLRSGWVVMGEQQVLSGYCLLLPDPVVANLNALLGSARIEFLDDMSRVGDALTKLVDAVRINYAIFGNVEPALHAHVFPRLKSEPEGIRTAQPWALDWGSAPRFSVEQHGPFKSRLARELGA